MSQRADFICDMAGSHMNVRVRGEIDHHTAVEIRNGIDAAIFEKRPRRLILDMSSVGFMDSSGLGLIMGRLSVMKELGGELIVYDPSQEIQGILTLAGMERVVKIEYSDAVKATFNKPSSHSPSRKTRTTSACHRQGTQNTRGRNTNASEKVSKNIDTERKSKL